MGSHHARVYGALTGGCELAGVYDPDEARAAELADRWNTVMYPTIEALLDAVDVVSIASPSGLHVEHALLALERSVDVLIEKPVSLASEEARRLQGIVADLPWSPIVQVGHIEHFNPAIREVRKLLAEQELVAIDLQRLSAYDGRIGDADVVQDLMLHDIHVLLSVAGAPVRRIHAEGRRVRSESRDDYAVASLVFEDGLIATLSASRVTEEKIRRMTATTTESHVTVDYLRRTIEASRWTSLRPDPDRSSAYRQECVVERFFVPTEEPLVAELSSFLECVRDRRAPEVGLEMGIRCLEVVEAVQDEIARARAQRPSTALAPC